MQLHSPSVWICSVVGSFWERGHLRAFQFSGLSGNMQICGISHINLILVHLIEIYIHHIWQEQLSFCFPQKGIPVLLCYVLTFHFSIAVPIFSVFQSKQAKILINVCLLSWLCMNANFAQLINDNQTLFISIFMELHWSMMIKHYSYLFLWASSEHKISRH